MKRFILFGGEYFYARGGWYDIQDTSNDAALLRLSALKLVKEDFIQWWHIYDVKTGNKVSKSKHQAHGVNDD